MDWTLLRSLVLLEHVAVPKTTLYYSSADNLVQSRKFHFTQFDFFICPEHYNILDDNKYLVFLENLSKKTYESVTSDYFSSIQQHVIRIKRSTSLMGASGGV